MTTSSLDVNQNIYISPQGREEFFQHITNNNFDLKYAFSSEYLEKWCLGKTYLPDYAYSHIRSLLKKEYKEWLRKG